MTASYIICPECKSALGGNDTSLTCSSCHQKYDTKWGFPILSKNRDYYYSPTQKNWLTDILDEYYPKIEKNPLEWERLLTKILGNIPDNAAKQEWIENLVDESRASYKYLLSLKPGGHVLNFGCGWDNTSINLARTARLVTAVDLTRQRIQVLALKKKYYGLDNIDLICCGDRPHLPFRDDTFDAVYVNGVLEWVASDWSWAEKKYKEIQNKPKKALKFLKEVYSSHRPRDIQLKMLIEWNRVLKPDGEIYIGIENRHSREYFGRRPDSHSTIWFGSLYPRWMANLVSLLTHHRPYLTYTYSQNGYRKLLNEAGFNRSRFFAMEPMYRRPTNIVNLGETEEIRNFVGRSNSRVRHMPPGLYARTCPSFGIVASQDSDPSSWVYGAASDFLNKTGLSQATHRVCSIKANRKNKFIIQIANEHDPRNGYVLKTPLNDTAREFMANNREGLNHLHAMLDAQPDGDRIKRLLPRHVFEGKYNGQAYFVETACNGRSWSDVASNADGEILDNLVEVMAVLSKLDFGDVSKEKLSANFRKKVDYLRPLVNYENRDGCCALDRITDRVLDAIDRYNGPAHLRKGDHTMGNIFIEGSQLTGLIDFDEHGATCFKLTDFAELVFSCSRIRGGVFWADSAQALVERQYDKLPASLKIEQRLTKLGSDPDELALAALSAWVNHVYYGLQHESTRYNAKAVTVLLDKVLASLAPVIC